MTAPNDHAKGALLFAGLFASGPDRDLRAGGVSDHTERLMSELGMPVRTAGGSMVSLHPPADPLAIRGFEVDLPGDITAAAFVLAAAELVPGSNVSTRRTGLNPTRAGILEVLRAFGGRMGITPKVIRSVSPGRGQRRGLGAARHQDQRRDGAAHAR